VTTAYEVNFDGLVGPTHNYAGLAFGNVASQRHRHATSNPKAAALQGLRKMKMLADLGVKQAVLPSQMRPDLAFLRDLGFTGSDADVLARAANDAPGVLAAASSASSMWAANAATVSPSADAADAHVHFTPANLTSHAHRAIEAHTTAAALKAIFPGEAYFRHHVPLPGAIQFSDDGAANHTRLCGAIGGPGVELFVFGRKTLGEVSAGPSRYPARQTYEASTAIARRHGLDPRHVVFAQQNPRAIDAGVFHNDVIAVGHQNVFVCHEQAYVDQPAVLDGLRRAFRRACGDELIVIVVKADEVSLEDAVNTYLFNSQIVTLPAGTMALICPVECREHAGAAAVVERIIAADDNPITAAHHVDTRQSMSNGGGPACLRLRVVLTDEELAATHPGIMLSDDLYTKLTAWVERHYRDELTPADLADPQLLSESRQALAELSSILRLDPRP
jgi:succinylarginine dihydrolase